MMPTEINRKIIISQPITDRLAGDVIDHILAINDYDEAMSGALTNYQIEPIEMFINSGGGSASAGFAIIGAMEMSETPIIAYGMGIVASMALGIFASADVRIAHRNCRFMFHSVAYGEEGFIQDHIDGLKEVKVVQKMYNSIFEDRTKFPSEMITKILKEKKNYFFSGKKAVEFGVADDVMKKPDPKIEMVSEEDYKAIMEQIEAEIEKSK
jgi:ATP-dependent Clp protease protease subunit